MTYATLQDLIDRYGSDELEKVAWVEGGGIDQTKVNQALTDADALINSELENRYTTPLVTVPAVIVSRACEIARYLLHDERANEIVENRYKDAIKWLQRAGEGKVSLGISADEDSSRSDNLVEMQSADVNWRRDDSSGFL